ncbi:MAG: carboxyl transferase [Lachnospiraceae bacterium]|nr:carboxyl transferase [Lachnospiraceae bacterium]
MSNSSKLSAKDRILTLLDDNSFVEIGSLVTKRNTDFNLQAKEAPSDGVITGYGTINDGPVYVYAQDASVLNGTIGEMHAKKISRIYDLAMKCGAPVVGLIDCGGLRIEEACDALEGLGEVMTKQVLASGVIPQIAVIFGSCGGGLSVSASLNDFVFVEKNGKLFLNTPNVVKGNNTDKCDTASAAFKAECGLADFTAEGEVEILNEVRNLVSVIPSCNEDDAVLSECDDDLNRLTTDFAGEAEDPAVALADLSDGGFFIEVQKDFAKDMVTGFIKLDGVTVGAVANRAVLSKDGKAVEKFDTKLTANGCAKATKFVNFCDAFDIPLLTVTNVDGYASCMCAEKKLSREAAQLLSAFADATCPKVNVIVKGIGSAYTVMNSKASGADMIFALEGAQIGPMASDLAVQILTGDQKDEAKKAEYEKLQLSAESAAKRGYVDAIISADDVRKSVVYAFEMLYLKAEDRPGKKHKTV